MEFLKKHYEKLILSVVLLGLAAVAAWLPIKVSQEKEKEEERKRQLIGAPVKPLKAVDLSTNEAVLTKVKTPIHFDIAGKHNLFNPVEWVKLQNGELIKIKTGNEVGIGAVEVLAIKPLKLIITFDGVYGDAAQLKNTNDIKYEITVVKETDRSKNQRAFAKGQSLNLGTLKDIKGPPEAPTEVIFVPIGEVTPITLSKEKPFEKVIGYSADIQYAPPGSTPAILPNRRKGDPVLVGNEAYNIVNIDKDRVVFQAKSNQKQTQKKVANSK